MFINLILNSIILLKIYEWLKNNNKKKQSMIN